MTSARYHHILTLCCVVSLFSSCEPRNKDTTRGVAAPSRQDPPPATPPIAPPPTQTAVLPALAPAPTGASTVGTYTRARGSLELAGISMNRCRRGWALQGSYTDSSGRRAVTPAFFIGRATLGTTSTAEPHIPIPGHVLRYKITHNSPDRLAGELEALGSTGEVVQALKFDGAPGALSANKQAGAFGCFHTGTFRLTRGPQLDTRGPVTAIEDFNNALKFHAELSPSHSITVWLHLPPSKDRPGELVEADLAKVRADPNTYPVRAFFATRPKTSEGDLFDWKRTPIELGQLRVHKETDTGQDFFRVELEGIQLPEDWDIGLAGERLDRLVMTARPVPRATPLIPPTPPSP